MVIDKVFNSQDSFHPISNHIDRPLYQALRAQRLASFRSLAGVCSAWTDTIRMVFWEEVTLFTVSELVAFARAVDDDSDSTKPACIRRLYFWFADYMDRRKGAIAADSAEAQRSFLIILRHMPVHLDVLHVHCDQNHHPLNETLYLSLRYGDQDTPWTIDVAKLIIASHPKACDISMYFAFARNVTHLVLTVTSRDLDTFDSPLPLLHLESLCLQLEFDASIHRSRMLLVANAVAYALDAACRQLQSFTLNLYRHDEVDVVTRTDAAKKILSLAAGPQVSALTLCANPAFQFIHIAKELADAHAFPRLSSLRRLKLDGSGVSPAAFQGMRCYALQLLEVTVMSKITPSRQDGVETMKDILASIPLGALDSLEHLVVNFSNLETSRDQDSLPGSLVSPWIGTKLAWKPLETACSECLITCTITYPE